MKSNVYFEKIRKVEKIIRFTVLAFLIFLLTGCIGNGFNASKLFQRGVFGEFSRKDIPKEKPWSFGSAQLIEDPPPVIGIGGVNLNDTVTANLKRVGSRWSKEESEANLKLLRAMGLKTNKESMEYLSCTKCNGRDIGCSDIANFGEKTFEKDGRLEKDDGEFYDKLQEVKKRDFSGAFGNFFCDGRYTPCGCSDSWAKHTIIFGYETMITQYFDGDLDSKNSTPVHTIVVEFKKDDYTSGKDAWMNIGQIISDKYGRYIDKFADYDMRKALYGHDSIGTRLSNSYYFADYQIELHPGDQGVLMIYRNKDFAQRLKNRLEKKKGK